MGRLEPLSQASTLGVPAWPYVAPSLMHVLHERTRLSPDRIGFTFVDYAGERPLDRPVTDAELDLRARAVAALLQTRCQRGDRVLLVYPAGIDYLVAFFGCLYAGVIAVPAYPPMNPRLRARLAVVAQDCGTAVALTSTTVLAQLGERSELPPPLSSLRWLPTDVDLGGFEYAWRPPEVSRDTVAFLQYTSGSTGTPKGVIVTHDNLLSNLYAIALHFELTPQDRVFSWLPPYHDMGLIGTMLGSLCSGLPLSFMTPAAFLRRPERWLREVSSRAISISGAPNFAYELCLSRISDRELETLDLSNWTLAFSGAEPVSPSTLQRFAARFASCGFNAKAFYPCYGMAETSLYVTGIRRASPARVIEIDRQIYAEEQRAVLTTGAAARALVGCGTVAAGHQLAIVDPETLQPCAEGEVGEILFAGPSKTAGYWCRPQETERAYNASVPGEDAVFLRTGDLGFLLDGELFVSGRLKDLIIVRGVNHYPHDIESTVDRCHEAVRPGCGIAFAANIDDVERLIFVQEVGRTDEARAEEIIAAIHAAIVERHEVQPYAVALIESGGILKTTSGKLSRSPCRDDYLNGRLSVLMQWINPALADSAGRSTSAAPSACTPIESLC